MGKPKIQTSDHDVLVNLEDDDLSSRVRYGSWRESKDGRYFVPHMLTWSDYSGSLVEKSNKSAFEEAFKDGDGVWWADVVGGHGTSGVIIDLQNVPDDVTD